MRRIDLIQGLLDGPLVDGNEFEWFSFIRGVCYVVLMRWAGILDDRRGLGWAGILSLRSRSSRSSS